MNINFSKTFTPGERCYTDVWPQYSCDSEPAANKTKQTNKKVPFWGKAQVYNRFRHRVAETKYTHEQAKGYKLYKRTNKQKTKQIIQTNEHAKSKGESSIMCISFHTNCSSLMSAATLFSPSRATSINDFMIVFSLIG